MDLRRLRVGEWLAGGTGLVLLVSLFLPWFDEQSGWESFVVTDLIVALVAVAALALLAVTARFRSASPAIAYEGLLTLAAMGTFLIVGIRMLSPPDDLVGRGSGAWLGLVASAGLVVACFVAMRDERLSKPGKLTDPSGVPVAAPREVETLPAPPAAST